MSQKVTLTRSLIFLVILWSDLFLKYCVFKHTESAHTAVSHCNYYEMCIRDRQNSLQHFIGIFLITMLKFFILYFKEGLENIIIFSRNIPTIFWPKSIIQTLVSWTVSKKTVLLGYVSSNFFLYYLFNFTVYVISWIHVFLYIVLIMGNFFVNI